MKTILNFKTKLVKLYAVVLLLPSFGGFWGGLYAQDPELFEHTWYLEKISINNEILFSPNPEINIILDFNDSNEELDYLEIHIPFCEDGHGGVINYNGDDFFNLETFDWNLLGVCTGEQYAEFSVFIANHYSIYAVNDGSGTPKNPFTYAIEPVDSYLQLTIENGEGDWAIYNSILLSTPSFNRNSFAIYPNPVKEILQVNNTSNQTVTAAIYEINGKLLQNYSLEINVSKINVKELKSGLYFIVFENEGGERVSKKFVKSSS